MREVDMLQAAVPRYVAERITDRTETAPGHRFSLYFPFFEQNWEPTKTETKKSLKKVLPMDSVKKLVESLVKRQIQVISKSGSEEMFHIIACKSQSPFATGLGNEHPLENGFSFLSPYGVPYLPGSSVKGVLRRAAELAALFPDEYPPQKDVLKDFSLLDVWLLFGFEGDSFAAFPQQDYEKTPWGQALEKQLQYMVQSPKLLYFINHAGLEAKEKEKYRNAPQTFLADLCRKHSEVRKRVHTRGALTFWDVFPDCSSLEIEVMTPHQSDYYQNGGTPHDAGQPNPIFFLTVPPDTKFAFFVQCDLLRLPEGYDWKPKLGAFFEGACKWQGFGAKTAVGFGDMRIDPDSGEKILKIRQNIIASEKKAMQEAAEKQACESLSKEVKKIFAFRKTFEKAKAMGPYSPSGEFASKRREFMKEVQTWKNLDDQKQAAALLEETFQWGKHEKQFTDFKKWRASLGKKGDQL